MEAFAAEDLHARDELAWGFPLAEEEESDPYKLWL
jgi:hypothetical protein